MALIPWPSQSQFLKQQYEVMRNAQNQVNQLAGGQLGGYRQANQALQNYSPYAPNPYYPGAFYPPSPGPAREASPPQPIEDAGIRAGEVRAWRCWLVKSGFLRSAAMETIWAPGELMTGDPKTSGVHAWKSLSKLLEYAFHGIGPVVVIGQVDLWGDIVEHEHGYRAEFADIVSLDGIFGADKAALAELRGFYHVGGRDDLMPPHQLKPAVKSARESYEELYAASQARPYNPMVTLAPETAEASNLVRYFVIAGGLLAGMIAGWILY